MNLSQAKEVLFRTHVFALERGERAPCYVLESPPGIGKSEGCFQYVERLALVANQPVAMIQFMLTTVTSPDVRGFMLPVKEPGRLRTVFSIPPWCPQVGNYHVCVPNEDGTVVWHKPEEWTDEIPDIGVLLLDEWGQADEDVKKPAAELILHANVGTTRLPIGWRVVAAQNRMSDRSGVLREMMFIVNRRGLIQVTPSMRVWVDDWAHKQPVASAPHYMTVSFAEKNPDIVFASAIPDKPDPYCTPRSLCLMDRALQALADDEDIDNGRMPTSALARETASGWIGEGAAAQFFTHLRFDALIPKISEIEADPSSAKLPDGMDAQMVTGHMLTHGITEDNAGQVMRYILRMKDEMQIMAVLGICRKEERAKWLLVQRGYNSWAIKHKDRLIAAQS